MGCSRWKNRQFYGGNSRCRSVFVLNRAGKVKNNFSRTRLSQGRANKPEICVREKQILIANRAMLQIYVREDGTDEEPSSVMMTPPLKWFGLAKLSLNLQFVRHFDTLGYCNSACDHKDFEFHVLTELITLHTFAPFICFRNYKKGWWEISWEK